MSIKSLFSNSNLNQYIDENSVKLNKVAEKLFNKAKNDEFSNMLSSPNQLQLISLFIKMINAKNILEIGVFRGFSTLVMAQALPEGGKIEACDISYEYIEPYKQFWQEAGVEDKINLNIAPALESLDRFVQLGKKFDFAYIDADKANYINYYEKTLSLMNSGGVIAIDNVLWSGRVADGENNEESTKTIRQLNELIHNDTRVEACIISIGDGVNLVRKL
ncbi:MULTISPECIES: O-methyltransferase [unclassified Francisella]|uniref:O-methyltransferase n=1 Tax=unclassified Francisella TaxID=2610885 RepID=UPI002E328EE2|nr:MULTISPECIES: class I SAM-dependent methyltransferase [unclassified Francisella]MED7820017.1 class I SAM-dependent methyltransferase [Francisella sp. 19S2-4]MED7830837.1 class I SAM-dependent methyltransferase [Francisella sp. 19S2-10]